MKDKKEKKRKRKEIRKHKRGGYQENYSKLRKFRKGYESRQGTTKERNETREQ